MTRQRSYCAVLPPRLRIEGDAAKKRELTAVFDSNDPQSLVEFLRNLGEFSITAGPEEIVIQ